MKLCIFATLRVFSQRAQREREREVKEIDTFKMKDTGRESQHEREGERERERARETEKCLE